MLTQKIKSFLTIKLKHLNAEGLIRVMEELDVEIVDRKLHNAVGMTMPDKIYLDIDRLRYHQPKFVYFVVLHEICHYKRIRKVGKKVIVELFKSKNFDEFFAGILKEELIADKYACILYFRFNDEVFPKALTQQLTEEVAQNVYSEFTKTLFGRVENEKDYRDLLKSFVFNEK